MSFLPPRAAAAVLAAALNATPAIAAAPTAPAPDDPLAVWDLTPLYRDEAAWRAAKDRLATELPQLAAFAGRMGEGPSVLLEALGAIEQRSGELGLQVRSGSAPSAPVAAAPPTRSAVASGADGVLLTIESLSAASSGVLLAIRAQ